MANRTNPDGIVLVAYYDCLGIFVSVFRVITILGSFIATLSEDVITDPNKSVFNICYSQTNKSR